MYEKTFICERFINIFKIIFSFLYLWGTKIEIDLNKLMLFINSFNLLNIMNVIRF